MTDAGAGARSPLRAAASTARSLATGRHSRRLSYARLRLTSRAPRTYMEKVRHKVAFDRDPVLTTMVDKIGVRDLVGAQVGPHVLPRAHVTTHDPDALPWHSLPAEYVVKATHGSGGVVIVWEGAPADARLPIDPRPHPWTRHEVRPEHADPVLLDRLVRHWLTLDYSWWPGRQWPEWAYEGVRPGVIVEELLRCGAGGLPDDVKVHVIHGRAAFIRIMTGRTARGYTAATYLPDWTPVPVTSVSHGWAVPAADPVPPPPPMADELVRVAEVLGQLTDSVRVDLYALPSRIVVGELTVYPNAGAGHYSPRSFDRAIGELWSQDYG